MFSKYKLEHSQTHKNQILKFPRTKPLQFIFNFTQTVIKIAKININWSTIFSKIIKSEKFKNKKIQSEALFSKRNSKIPLPYSEKFK